MSWFPTLDFVCRERVHSKLTFCLDLEMITNQGVQLGGREIGLLVVGRVGGRRPLRPRRCNTEVIITARSSFG